MNRKKIEKILKKSLTKEAKKIYKTMLKLKFVNVNSIHIYTHLVPAYRELEERLFDSLNSLQKELYIALKEKGQDSLCLSDQNKNIKILERFESNDFTSEANQYYVKTIMHKVLRADKKIRFKYTKQNNESRWYYTSYQSIPEEDRIKVQKDGPIIHLPDNNDNNIIKRLFIEKISNVEVI